MCRDLKRDCQNGRMEKLQALLLNQGSVGPGKSTGQGPTPPQIDNNSNGRSYSQQNHPSGYRGQKPRSNPGQTQQPPVYGQNINFDYHNWQQMMMPPGYPPMYPYP
ncbi:unnamed protein product, partial [Allacma fusca]